MNGPFFGVGWGLHTLVVLVAAVAWTALLAGLVVLLYVVIRLAVIHAILRADAIRDERRRSAAPPAERPAPPPPAGPATGEHPSPDATA